RTTPEKVLPEDPLLAAYLASKPTFDWPRNYEETDFGRLQACIRKYASDLLKDTTPTAEAARKRLGLRSLGDLEALAPWHAFKLAAQMVDDILTYRIEPGLATTLALCVSSTMGGVLVGGRGMQFVEKLIRRAPAEPVTKPSRRGFLQKSG